MGVSAFLRPIRLPERPTAALGGRARQSDRLLLEEPGLPDYPSQFLLEDNNRILMEQ